MKLGVTLDILNQKDTPAFYADTLANRPAAGFTGRVFISTDTLDLYRDTGTTWVLLSPSSTGTITGSGAAGQVTYFSAASSITGSNDLFFDSVNGHLGIGTITPSTALTIFHDQNQIIQLNQTTATNDTKIAFQNSGTPLWRIGNSYNAGANDFAIFNVITATNSLLIDVANNVTSIGSIQSNKGTSAGGTPQFVLKNANNTRAVFGLIGTEGTNTGSDTFLYNYLDNGTAVPVFRTTRATGNIDFSFTGSFGGKLIVSTATSDSHIQIVGANAPSLRLDNAQTGATKRIGIGISTASNNFIQGSVDRDMCIFNGSTTPSPILFGIDSGTGLSTEAVRISASRNLLVGSSVDTGQKLQITGEQVINSTATSSSLKINTTNVANWGTNIEFQQSGTFFGFFGSYGSLVGTTNKDLTSYSSAGSGFRVNVNNSAISSLIIASNGIATFSNNVNIGDTTSSANALTTYQNSLNGFQFGLATTGTQRFIFINGGAAECANINGATGVYTPVSDINKKKNFEDSTLGLDAILKLKPTLYNMKSQEDSEPKELGLIAQEVKDVISQAYVQCDEFIGINYNPIIVTLVKAIQELNTKIETLKN